LKPNWFSSVVRSDWNLSRKLLYHPVYFQGFSFGGVSWTS